MAAARRGCPARTIPTLDLIYWAIGNPCPDFAGEERLGDNLYTSSVVALEAKTGRMKWYYQFTPHDTHDWDSVQPMVLADEIWEGKPRKLLFHGDRNGIFYVLDRTTGQLLKTGNLASKVTWVKGFAADGKPIVDPGSVATRDGIAACPGGGGGANFHAVSYNPMTKLFYVRVSDSCQVYTSHEDPLGARGNRWFGGGPASEKAREALAALTKGYTMGAFIRAMDPFAAKKVWDMPNPGGEPGILSTSTGLVFLPGDGGLLVLDGKTRQDPAQHQSRPHLVCGADDLHGRRQAIRRASRHGDAHRLRASLTSSVLSGFPAVVLRMHGSWRKLSMKIRDVMTSNPRTVSPNDTIQAAARIMQSEDTGAVPVVNDGRVLAVVTDRDIVVRVVAEGGSFSSPVSNIATGNVICASPEMSTREASELMSEHQIRRLPVVENDRLVGIVSIGDLAVKEGKDSRWGDTLQNISEGVKEKI